MIKIYWLKHLILLFLLFMGIQAYPQDLLSEKSMWEINSGIDINIPKESNYNYIQYLGEYNALFPKDSYIDVNVKSMAVISPYINLCRSELLFNIKGKHIIRGGYGVFFYKKNYQMSYSGSDMTRNYFFFSFPDSTTHSGKETFNINNFGINLSVLYFYKISKFSFLLNKFEVNLADPYLSNHSFSDTSHYNGNIFIRGYNNKERLYNKITFPFPTLTLNYYFGVSFTLFSKFSVTPNIGVQLLRKDFDKKRELYYWEQDLFNDGTYLINNHYLFTRAGISLSFKFN